MQQGSSPRVGGDHVPVTVEDNCRSRIVGLEDVRDRLVDHFQAGIGQRQGGITRGESCHEKQTVTRRQGRVHGAEQGIEHGRAGSGTSGFQAT
ncbi:hypothetical protein D3C79_1003650 [compost metagenome]